VRSLENACHTWAP